MPGRALPPYRYVPGLNPHPFRTPGGHAYTDGSAPEEKPWDPTLPWEKDLDFLHACDLFDQRYWWEAHEAWEAIWHAVPRTDPLHNLLQALIQISASLLKRHLGTDGAADRLMARARARLHTARQAMGDVHRGIDLAALDASLEAHSLDGTWTVLPRA